MHYSSDHCVCEIKQDETYKLLFSYHEFGSVQVKEAEGGPRGRLRSLGSGGAETIGNAIEVAGCCGGTGNGGRLGKGGGKKGWTLCNADKK